MKTCRDLMTADPVCCLPSNKVKKAAKKMKRHNVGSIPVIDNKENRTLLGIVTDRDLAMKVIGKGRKAKATKVKDVMSRTVVTCSPDDTVQQAFDAMSAHQVRRIVIVDEGNRVLGIISQADVATRISQPDATAEVLKEISQPEA
jgi:CBS domain-containing protein